MSDPELSHGFELRPTRETRRSDPHASRTAWCGRLTTELARLLPGSPDRPRRIGIIGALGAHDVGDEAMLLAVMEELRSWDSQIEIRVFSMRPKVTSKYLGSVSYPTLHVWAYDRTRLVSIILYALDRVETLVTSIVRRVVPLREEQAGGWMMRLAFGRMIVKLRRIARRRAHGSPSAAGRRTFLHQHVEDIAANDALLVLGGGYLNSWHVKARTLLFLGTVEAAIELRKPVFATGLNLGPYNSYDRRRVGRVLGELNLIGVRDRRESFDELRAMGIFAAERHMFSSDDAVSLPATPLGDGRLDALVKGIGAYVAVQLHYWHMPPAHVERLLGGVAEALDRMVEKRGCSVLMIPMTFGDRARSDRALLEELRRRSAHPGRFHMAPDDLKPQQLKYLFGQASSAVVSRHHAMVFSITSGVHCAAIVLDPYYRMKLRGVADDYPGLAVLLEESEATPTSLLGALEPPFQIVAHE